MKVAVLFAEKQPEDKLVEAARSVLLPQDEVVCLSAEDFKANRTDFDVAIVLGVCGSNPLVETLAGQMIPCMAIEPYHAFHPYHAAFYRDVERAGGIVLPAEDPKRITASLAAVRARKTIRSSVLLVVDVHENDFRAEQVRTFAQGAEVNLGVNIIRRPVAELLERAAGHGDSEADKTLKQWYAQVLDGPGEMDSHHMRQVAKLYLAEREMIDETGACGITVEDIGGFLLADKPKVMPNVSYGVLAFEGILAAEEGDIEVLASQLLLHSALGEHPTMSNIYLAYRDSFTALAEAENYTSEMELADYYQCINDNHVTAAHFSTSGILPPNMMEESRYRVREALPAWPGQSMISATPKLGPVMMARLTSDAAGVHLVGGRADSLGFGDRYGWYRGRWFIKIPNVSDFIARCLHQHYAISPIGGKGESVDVLEILSDRLLRLTKV